LNRKWNPFDFAFALCEKTRLKDQLDYFKTRKR
jgi:hypothetical protein